MGKKGWRKGLWGALAVFIVVGTAWAAYEQSEPAWFRNKVTFSHPVTFEDDLILTLGIGDYLRINANGGNSTVTTGALDVNYKSATNGAEAVNVMANIASTAGTVTIAGITVDLDDDCTGGTCVVQGIAISGSDVSGSADVQGISIATSIEKGAVFNVGAANKAIVVDAATVDSTQATGVIDVDWDSNTANSEAVNIKATHLTGGSGQTISAVEIELDADSGNASDVLQGLFINVSDATATGKVNAIQVTGAGTNAAFQANHGFVRIGTGSTPDVTPGDDDFYAEGTGEFDGILYPDGGIDRSTAAALAIGATNATQIDIAGGSASTGVTISSAGVLTASGQLNAPTAALTTPKLTAGTGTGVTVNDVGSLRTQVYKVSLAKENFTTAGVNHDLTIATLPAGTIVHTALARVTEQFACTAVCTSATLSATLGITAGGVEFLESFDLDAAVATFGDADAEVGTALDIAGDRNGGYISNLAGTTTVVMRAVSGTGNWGDGASATNLSAGAVTFYLIASVLP